MKTKFYLSAALGACFGLIFGLVLFFVDRSLAWLGSAAGVLFALCILISLIISERTLQKRYEKAEREVKKEFRQKENVNVRYQGKVKNGNLYLFDDEVLILCFDGKPYWRFHILISDIRSLDVIKEWEFVIRTAGAEIAVTAVDAEALCEKIRHISLENSN